MPHLTPERKEQLAAGLPIENAGSLNYLISMLLKRYWVNSNRRYQDLNDCLGALEGAKLEFNRLIVIPYEDAKIKENGNAYGSIK